MLPGLANVRVAAISRDRRTRKVALSFSGMAKG
jgi:hypothetical protein